jgi:hypothetical protein
MIITFWISRGESMTIKVTLIAPDESFQFMVEFSHIKQRFTKKAARKLKNKLITALDELEVHEAMKDDYKG